MRKKLNIISLICGLILISYFLIYNYFIKNLNCRGETYKYEIWNPMPINFTERIESGECECISSQLFINSKIKLFSKQQLSQIRIKLPNWIDKNIKNLSSEFKIKLKDLISKSDEELLNELNYRYSFLDRKTGCEIYVSSIKINSIKIYLMNYKNIYLKYYEDSLESDSLKFNLKKDISNLSIIQSEAWIKTQFGEKGI